MKKKSVRVISLLFALTLVLMSFTTSFVDVFAKETTEVAEQGVSENDTTNSLFSQETQKELQVKTDLGEQVFEIESLREERVKHFRLEDGSFQAVVYAEPVHRKNSDGQWETIDNTLLNKGDYFETKDGRVSFSEKTGGENGIYTLQENGYFIGFGLLENPNETSANVSQPSSRSFESKLEELKNVERNSAEISYNRIFDNTSIKYRIESGNIKEEIIINEKKADDNYEYTFRLSLTGLTAVLSDNSVVLSDSITGEERYLIPSPFMYDGNEVSNDVFNKLVQQGEGEYLLSIVPDAEWINDEDRQFPVVIDPSLLYVGQTADTYVNYPATTSNYGSEPELWVSDGDITYYRFATPHFPSGTTISSASVKLPYYYNVVNNNSILVNVYSITSDWNELSVNWSNKPSTPTTRLDQQALYANGALSNNPQYAVFNVTSYVQSWYTGTTNYGFALKRGGGTNNSVIFVAREKMQISAQLVINYSGTHLAEGVYAIRKQNLNTYFKADIPTTTVGLMHQDSASYSSPPVSLDHLENLFKISYRPNQDDYVIRCMLDNSLVVCPLTAINAVIVRRRTESDNNMPTSYTWKIVYDSGDYYYITYTSGGTTYYVRSSSTTNNATLLLTTDPNASGTKWSFCRYEGNACEVVVFDETAPQLLPGESYTFKAHMYSTQIGHNGPLTYSVTNADGTTTDKATINSSTGVLQALKTGKIKVRATYSGAPRIWQEELIVSDVVQVSCYNSSGFWDIPNGASDQTVECNEENQLVRSTWQFIHQNNDYYLIKNTITGYYLKNSSNQLVHTLHTSSLYPDNMVWKVIHQEDNSYKIQSKSNSSYYITEQNVSHSSQDPDILLSNESAGQRQLWTIRTGRLYLQISYDNGFIEWNKNTGESTSETQTRIESNIKNDYLIKVSDAFADQCGVYLDFYSLSLYSSDADNCPDSGINDNCTCISTPSCILQWDDDPSSNNNIDGFSHNCHHKSMTRLRNNLIHDISRNHILITYTGHSCCFRDNEVGHDYNTLWGLSDYDNPIICMRINQSNRSYSILVIAHEITHTFGIVHHSVRSSPCIMDSSHYAANDPDVPSTYWCQECIDAIKSRINNY